MEVLHSEGESLPPAQRRVFVDALSQNVVPLQNGENQDPDSISKRNKGQLSQPGRRKGYSDSQSSDERPWLDSPVDTDDITVQVPPPVAVSICRHAEYLIRKSKLIFREQQQKLDMAGI